MMMRTSSYPLLLMLLGVVLQGAPTVTTAFDHAAFFVVRRSKAPGSAGSGSSWRRPALIYMPDGEVIQDEDVAVEDESKWMVSSTAEKSADDDSQHCFSEAILEYLNGLDFRGPLAVIAAPHANIDITTIEHVQVVAVTQSAIQIEAICSREDMHCVNVLVSVDLPNAPCETDTDVMGNLNILHQEASVMLEEQRKLKEESEEQQSARRLDRILPRRQMAEVNDESKQEPAKHHHHAPTKEEEKTKQMKQKPWEDGSLSLAEKCFAILLDLDMIQITPDPRDTSYDRTKDDELCPENNFITKQQRLEYCRKIDTASSE